jgi:hypothetical protein
LRWFLFISIQTVGLGFGINPVAELAGWAEAR